MVGNASRTRRPETTIEIRGISAVLLWIMLNAVGWGHATAMHDMLLQGRGVGIAVVHEVLGGRGRRRHRPVSLFLYSDRIRTRGVVSAIVDALLPVRQVGRAVGLHGALHRVTGLTSAGLVRTRGAARLRNDTVRIHDGRCDQWHRCEFTMSRG